MSALSVSEFSDFFREAYDGRDLVGIAFAAGPAPGDYVFILDRVRFESSGHP